MGRRIFAWFTGIMEFIRALPRIVTLSPVILQNVRRNKKNFVFASIGITVGVCVFSFFTALTLGIRQEVLNRIYPVDLIEIEPASVNIAGAKKSIERIGFNQAGVEKLESTEGIARVFPKLRSKFQATYRIGGEIFGKNGVTFEAYFDGLDDSLLRAELQQTELARARKSAVSRLQEKYGRKHRCYDSTDCAPGEECRGGLCNEIEYWSAFRDRGEYIPCENDSICADGAACIHGQCRNVCSPDLPCRVGECIAPKCRADQDCGSGACNNGTCTISACFPSCAAGCPPNMECIATTCLDDSDCADGPCINGRCALASTCTPIKCVQNHREAELMANPELRRGEVPTRREGLAMPPGSIRASGSPSWSKAREGQGTPACPPSTYCSVHTYFKPGNLWWDKRGEGRCEEPIPVVLNPIVLEIFNMVLSSTLEKTQLGSVETLLGYTGTVTFGHSFYKETVKDRTPVEKQLVVVGFSSKALEAGVTMPMPYVQRANARYKGRTANRDYDSMIIQLSAAEHLPAVMEKLDQYNLQLSRRSADAEKFRTVLLVAMAIFFIMASIILGIAAINITHTFLMVIYERKKEIGILRALGATKVDIKAMFLGESLLIGLAGGTLGNLAAWGLSLAADYFGNKYIGAFPFRPDTFFLFEPPLLVLSVVFAMVFSIIGAAFPANRAAAMDPARVLTLS